MSDSIRFEERDGQIGVVTIDVPEKKVNTLARPVVEELMALVNQLAERSDLRGLLFCSGKPGQFIAGADLNELGELVNASRDSVQAALTVGHELFDAIGRLPFPTVALIDGNCMGGGTELALAMDYRIASDRASTRIALPEVKVGLIPGWGGTQRLPRLIGVSAAIEMITSGEPISAAKAISVGLVFDSVPVESLFDEGRRLIEYAIGADEWQSTREFRRQPIGLSDDQRNFIFGVAEGAIQAKTRGQYPAPVAALRAIKEGANRPLDEALQVEREIALDVIGSPVSGNLIGVFFMNNRLSRDRGVNDSAVEARPIQRVGVLGAGQMGSGIATAHARRGVACAMVDIDNDRIAAGLARARHVVESRIKIGRATPDDLANMLCQLSTSTAHAIFADCELVVEAVPEKESLKTEMYRQLAGLLRDDAILASNTSTISITRMAEAAPNPERFIGMHFFYPVDRMQLVEVIRGEKTDDQTIATIVALARRVGKTPIVMKDCAGFLVNRILLPYMSEAVRLLLEGAEMDQIDKTATSFGMPMGPIALHDFVGLDTACSADKVVSAAYSDRAVHTPLLEQLVAAGRLGKKSGAGFRKFVGKKARPVADPDVEPFLEQNQIDDRTFSQQEIEDRLFLPMLLEATRCLEEEIVQEPTHVDMGVLLGIGFPAFRGGILHWCDSLGTNQVLEKLELYISLGKRFEATDLLKQHAQSGDGFFTRS